MIIRIIKIFATGFILGLIAGYITDGQVPWWVHLMNGFICLAIYGPWENDND